MTDQPTPQPKRPRGRPKGWRKRPDEPEWRAIGWLLPQDVHAWISDHKEELIKLVRRRIKQV